MRHVRVGGWCFLLAVLVFAAAVPLVAWAGTERQLGFQTEGGALNLGSSEITATSSNLVLTTKAGDLECASSVLSGRLEGSGSVNWIKSEMTAAALSGAEEGGDCKTTFHSGRAAVLSSGLPWTFQFEINGQAFLTGDQEVTLTAAFPEGGAECEFESKKAKGSFEVGTSGPVPLVLTISGQRFKLVPKAGETKNECPKVAKLGGVFSFTSEGETVVECIEEEGSPCGLRLSTSKPHAGRPESCEFSAIGETCTITVTNTDSRDLTVESTEGLHGKGGPSYAIEPSSTPCAAGLVLGPGKSCAAAVEALYLGGAKGEWSTEIGGKWIGAVLG